MKVRRSDRLNGEIQKAVYEIITKKLKNPYITEMFSITRAEVASDLSHAKIFVSVYSGSAERKKRTFDEIAASAKTIRYELARMLTARTVPELHFFVDDSMEYSAKMQGIFNSLKGENNDD